MKDDIKIEHSKEIPKLNRIIGQLEGIKKMIENKRDCVDILIQLKASRSAIKSVESNILSAHLDHCVVNSFDDREKASKSISEIKKLLNKYQD